METGSSHHSVKFFPSYSLSIDIGTEYVESYIHPGLGTWLGEYKKGKESQENREYM